MPIFAFASCVFWTDAHAAMPADRTQNGRIHAGMVRVIFELSDIHAGDAATHFLVGSHKAAFPMYPSHMSLEEGRRSPYLVSYACPAGSAVFFTEVRTTMVLIDKNARCTNKLAVRPLFRRTCATPDRSGSAVILASQSCMRTRIWLHIGTD
jgi:hypothetical protein